MSLMEKIEFHFFHFPIFGFCHPTPKRHKTEFPLLIRVFYGKKKLRQERSNALDVPWTLKPKTGTLMALMLISALVYREGSVVASMEAHLLNHPDAACLFMEHLASADASNLIPDTTVTIDTTSIPCEWNLKTIYITPHTAEGKTKEWSNAASWISKKNHCVLCLVWNWLELCNPSCTHKVLQHF